MIVWFVFTVLLILFYHFSDIYAKLVSKSPYMIQQEYELKFAVTDEQIAELETKLVDSGFLLDFDHRETDYVPDTPDYLMRQNNFMIRFRGFQAAEGSDILYTLKDKQEREDVQHYQELQAKFSDPRIREVFTEVNQRLAELGINPVPDEVLSLKTLDKIIPVVRAAGLTGNRMLSDKDRKQYSRGDLVVTIDRLPKDIGQFVELEAPTKEAVYGLKDQLGFADEDIDTRNYGLIIQTAQKERGATEEECRVCLFEDQEIRPF